MTAHIHVPSALVGLGLALLAGLALAASPVGYSADLRDPTLDPKRLVRIEEGTPYTVPSDRALIVRQLTTLSGITSGTTWVALNVNSQTVIQPQLSKQGGNGGWDIEPVADLGLGVVAQPGDVVNVVGEVSSTEGVALGVLVNL